MIYQIKEVILKVTKTTNDEESINDKENQIPRIKFSITDIQTFKNNVIETRDLLFLRKDVTYFIDSN